MENPGGCLICGKELVYRPEEIPLECICCRQHFHSNVTCAEGHYVCDRCHAQSGIEWIETFCLRSGSVNPLEMASDMMRNEKIKMHGPEHHYLVPAALIAAYCNATGDASKSDMLDIARKRAEKIPGGFCGTHGSCGAGMGAGIFISIITKSTPLAREAWSLSNRMTGESLLSIARHGGPRCCKRDTYLAIEEAIRFVREHFGVTLEASAMVCRFSANNRECLKRECLFFPAG